MRTVLIACRTMQKEFETIFEEYSIAPDEILWIKSGLHNTTDALRVAIQEACNQTCCADRVLLGFAACGNALAGVKTRAPQTVVPRVDDCISLMLGSYERKKEIQSREGETYFLTKGWLNGESNIYKEYVFCVENYGTEMADELYREILGAYKNLGIIDSKACDYEALLNETEIMARELHLKQIQIPGTLSYLERLIMGPWEESDFLVLPPDVTIGYEMFHGGAV